ncbi:MAG: (d)CMP kinase [Candidatus Dadabacteria bacterium]|nr:(d)CMP kinase [Candidatus Dadabacteria bacterium]NIQ15239.1 (d)CMP kinase [Candidatus Dadabacteria bacterium]
MSNEKSIITIDGPSGAGKGTVAKIVADKLGYSYLDTGAMYRILALKFKRSNCDIDNENEIRKLLDSTKIELSKQGELLLDSAKITSEIRTQEISLLSSKLATKSQVRHYLVNLQRKIGKDGKIVVEGRDMGTYVFPNAKHKFYLDASLNERARRRYEQFNQNNTDFQTVLNELKIRDKQDMTREQSPLHPAMNAVIIDSTNLTISEVVGKILLNVGGTVQ